MLARQEHVAPIKRAHLRLHGGRLLVRYMVCAAQSRNQHLSAVRFSRPRCNKIKLLLAASTTSCSDSDMRPFVLIGAVPMPRTSSAPTMATTFQTDTTGERDRPDRSLACATSMHTRAQVSEGDSPDPTRPGGPGVWAAPASSSSPSSFFEVLLGGQGYQ